MENDLQTKTGIRSHPALMAIFVSLLVLMQFGWSNVRGTGFERFFIDEITVKPAAWLIARLTSEIPVQAIGSHLNAPGGGINILNGCDGMDIVLLLVAAMLVAPIPAYQRLTGILAGSGLIYLCNQVRILALFYSCRTDKALFNLLHGLIAPVLLIFVASAFFVLWLGISNSKAKPAKAV